MHPFASKLVSIGSGSVLWVAMTAGLWACGSSDADSGEQTDGAEHVDKDGVSDSGSGTATNGTFYCCINGAYYDCPGDAEVIQCAGFDVDACMSACAFGDFACEQQCFDQWANATPDTSGCARQEAADATCADGPSTGTGTGVDSGGCTNGSADGAGCDYDSDCCSDNCHQGTCYGNTNGNPCDYDEDCDSDNCYQSTCYGNYAGQPCDYDEDCDSNNCAGSQCQ